MDPGCSILVLRSDRAYAEAYFMWKRNKLLYRWDNGFGSELSWTHFICLQKVFYCLPGKSLHCWRYSAFFQENHENWPVIFSLLTSSVGTHQNRCVDTYLSPRNISILLLSDLQQVCENAERNAANPLSLDEMRVSVEVMMHGNLDKIARQLCPAWQQNLGIVDGENFQWCGS